MKIGILSMQRVKNYGSFLQAYALKNVIESLGNDVEFIDYYVEAPVVSHNVEIRKTSVFKKMKNLIIRIFVKKERQVKKWYKLQERFLNDFNNVYFSMLGLTKNLNYRSKVDTLVIGSDEVFNCTQREKDVGYSKELFGYNNNAGKLISYAACFGSTTIDKLNKYNLSEEIKEMLSKFKNISVRDENSYNIVKELLNKDVNLNLDPVFIYNFDDKIKEYEVKIKDYIIVYAYNGRIKKDEEEKIVEFARKNKKKIITIGTIQEFCDEYIIASPFELLSYFKNADYIVTDTFHGVVFSIKYNKKFVAIARENNKQKLEDLLNRFNLKDRLLKNDMILEDILTQKINYNIINQKIEMERNKSIKYLKENI